MLNSTSCRTFGPKSVQKLYKVCLKSLKIHGPMESADTLKDVIFAIYFCIMFGELNFIAKSPETASQHIRPLAVKLLRRHITQPYMLYAMHITYRATTNHAQSRVFILICKGNYYSFECKTLSMKAMCMHVCYTEFFVVTFNLSSMQQQFTLS